MHFRETDRNPGEALATYHAIDPKGFIFEFLVIALFRRGGTTYNYRRMDTGETQQLYIHSPIKFIEFQSLYELRNLATKRISDSEDMMDIDTDGEDDGDADEAEDVDAVQAEDVDVGEEDADETDEEEEEDANEEGDVDSDQEDVAMTEDMFLLPGQINFPAVHLIRIPKTKAYVELFQITESKRHDISAALQDIIHEMRSSWGIHECRLIFVVPNKLCDGYNPQKYKGKEGNFTQWVLGVDFTGQAQLAEICGKTV